MAIKTSTDLNQAIIYLQKKNPTLINILDKDMKSTDTNRIAKNIENQLDILYEKIRVVQDVNAYIHEFIESTIKNKKAQFDEILKLTEQGADSLIDTSYITYSVPFINNIQRIKDRDGSKLKQMTFNSGILSSKVINLQSNKINRLIVDANIKCYNRNSEALIDGKTCKSFYVTAQPITGGVVEEYTITFNNKMNCNYLDITSVNSDVSNIKAIVDYNTEVPLDICNKFFPEKNIQGLKFTLTCKNYSDTEIAEDGSTLSRDSFINLPIGSSSDNVNPTSTVKEIINSMDAINKNRVAKNYKAQYNQWLKNYTKTEKNNILDKEVI